MTKYYFVVTFVLIFILAGCGNSSCYDKLKEVDSLSEIELNDSAQKVLNIIEQTYKIKDGRDRAYYSLLKYQLQFRRQYYDKNLSVDNNLIDYSIAYYTKHYDSHKFALSYYLKSRMSEDKDAIIYLKKAEIASQKTSDYYLKMRIYNQLICININNEDYDTALKYGLKAIKDSCNIKNKETLLWCFINLSVTYGNLGYPDSAAIYINKCLPHVENVSNEQKMKIYINAAAILEDTDTIKAKEYALKSLEIRKSNNAYQILAKIARDNKDYKLSEAYLTEALKYSPSIDWEAFILHELSQTKTLLGKHEEAARISKEVIRLRDSVEYIQARDSIKELQMAADIEYKNNITIEKKNNHIAIIAISLSVIILITIGGYVTKRRKMKQAIEVANKKAEKEAQKAEKARKEKEDIERKKEAQRIANIRLKEKMAKEEIKRKTEAEERYRVGMEIYNKVKTGNNSPIKWNKEEEKAFIEYYQIISPEFKNDVATKYATLTESKLIMLILKDLGYSNKDIAIIRHTTEGAVRTQMSRIKGEIENL